MSLMGKIVVVGVVGVACYYTFVEKRNPLAQFWSNPVEAANKDYVKHKIGAETLKNREETSGRKAPTPQENSGTAGAK